MTTRIYAIKKNDAIVALVRASTPSTALAFMAAKTWTAERAKSDDVYAAATNGMKMQDVGDASPAPVVERTIAGTVTAVEIGAIAMPSDADLGADFHKFESRS